MNIYRISIEKGWVLDNSKKRAPLPSIRSESTLELLGVSFFIFCVFAAIRRSCSLRSPPFLTPKSVPIQTRVLMVARSSPLLELFAFDDGFSPLSSSRYSDLFLAKVLSSSFNVLDSLQSILYIPFLRAHSLSSRVFVLSPSFIVLDSPLPISFVAMTDSL